MTRLIQASLHYPVVTVVLTVLVVFAGIHALFTMPRTEDPSITIRTGLIVAQYPGATAEQVETQVTRVIEEKLFTFPEVRKDKTFSTSRPGLTFINVELQDRVTNADVFWSKLRENLLVLSQTSLPRGVIGPLVNSDFGDTVALLVAIHGEGYDYRQLQDYVDRIQDELRRIDDVGRMLTYGGQNEQIRITGSLSRISQYITNPSSVVRALQQRNAVLPSGAVDTPAASVPLRASDAFESEEEIRNVLVDLSRTGEPVYVRDLGRVERHYADPTRVIRFDGSPAVLLSVEMQAGRNIVEMGAAVDEALARLRETLPPDLRIDVIANQPEVVQERLSSLGEEFLLAVGSVILVTILLLPIRVAAIAALAIPVTLLATVAALNAIGISLHQVSIAALIVVLGIVVDDAIVIADNYLELLDHGVPREEAAWRSAADVVVPVLTATLTIIASFLPLLILTGATGEFISALPITVATALSVSFIVAIVLTPILCRTFISKGLHDHSAPADDADAPRKRRSVLDVLQGGYGRTIAVFMRRRFAAVALGLLAVAIGGVLFRVVPQQFFPSAERDQFVIDVWMKTGTRIEATDAVMRRIEEALRQHEGVEHFAAFVGESAPRFYYNVSPQQPDESYGQFIVNTVSADATPRIVAELRTKLGAVAPEAMVIVKELQQGAALEAPVEVRITGDDTATLQQLGAHVQDLARGTHIAQFVHSDYFADVLTMDVKVDPERANRLGINNAVVSQLLAGGLDGVPIGTFWEGKRRITMVMRLEEDERASFEDIRNAYVISPITQARVPLRAIATLEPTWQAGRIVRRNGVRTLTVRAFPRPGVYGSTLQQQLAVGIREMKVPQGYRIEFGGELANQNETMPKMLAALGISLLAIFLVLLVQFRTVRDPIVIMCSIPLALFGAMVGLLVTRNPFGFTAFMGLISLAGIVVRNAIILVEYVHERRNAGESVEQAAAEAGARRLRPIFLTTMAAAVGVTPMILSGSSLWSPLASVIASGLICSMFFTLVLIPIVFVIVEKRFARRAVAAATAALCLLGASSLASAQPRRLTLEEAIALALEKNTALAIARTNVSEQVAGQTTARADYFPKVTTDATATRLVNPSEITIPAGSLGRIEPLGAFPPTDTVLPQGLSGLVLANVTVGQPLTQLLKVRAANAIAAAERHLSEANQAKAEQEIRFAVRQVYFGILAMQRQREAALAGVEARVAAVRDAESAVASGHALEGTAMGARALLMQDEYAVLETEHHIADLGDELATLVGSPDSTFELVEPVDETTLAPVAVYVAAALASHPDVRAAEATVEKAQQAVRAARYDFVPDVSAFARYTYQNGVPFLPSNNASVGVQMTWDIFDGGKRRSVVGRRQLQLEQAQLNVQRVRERLGVDVEKAHRKAERARRLVEVAEHALAAAREVERTATNQVEAGFATESKGVEARAAVANAEFKRAQARIGYEIAVAELERAVGAVAATASVAAQ